MVAQFSIAILSVACASVSGFRLGQRSSRASSLMMADKFIFGILGDLHLDPRFMDDHYAGRDHFNKILLDKNGNPRANSAVVSVGDLGESKSISPETTKELFAGTTSCFELARDYLQGFKVPYEVVGGNHDLEGIDEFPTDSANLEAYLRILGKPTPQFKRLIAEKTLLVGLGSVLFRDAIYTSHEVVIDDEQVAWFEQTIKDCPAEEGWKVFVFSHAPPMGSGLRVLQENHVVNGCCWLNHSGKNPRVFIDIVRNNACIKAWFSGHFHLGQDYEDSITYPEGNNRGCCVFAQTAVMGKKSTRDGRQQSRLVRGSEKGFTISTIDHKKDGLERLDATVTFVGETKETVVYAHPSEDFDHEKFFKAYTPQADDGCYLGDCCEIGSTEAEKVCWWHMACGRVLGLHNGMLLEYDPSTLAPLGLVVSKDELTGKQLALLDSGIDADKPDHEKQKDREQTLVLYDDQMNITVIQPNEDGSYWRKIVRNKVVRMKEVRREKAAIKFIKQQYKLDKDAVVPVKSSWGPYTTTSGTAKTTGVPGLTAPAKSSPAPVKVSASED